MASNNEFDTSFFEDLFENATSITAVTDVNGIILKVNKRALYMFFGQEHGVSKVIGRNILEFIHKDDKPKVIERWKQSVAQQKEVNYEIRMTAGDGHIMYFLISGRPIIKDGKVHMFHYQAIDMIDQKIQEQNQLQSASAEIIAQIAGGFAHDFNNLLTVINGYSEIMKMSIDEGNPLHNKINQVCQAGMQASILTKRMLEFSRRNSIEAKPLDVNAEITNQESILKHVIGENIMLNIVKTPGLHPVILDHSQFTSLLINLTVNAKEAMPKGGEITIVTESLQVGASNESTFPQVPHGEYLHLTVRDTGEGMTEEVRRQIFDPFFSTREGGKGIGLWTVNNIISAVRGFIFVDTMPGAGTTITILIPFSSPDSQKKQVQALELKPETFPAGSKTILIVEDDDTVRDLVCEVLKQQGHVIMAARNGGDALQLARQFEGKIDLLITDMVMRRIDGKMLSRKIKSIWPHIKVMFMSGYGGDVVGDDDLKDNVFLPKPFLPQDLIEKVMRAFQH
ncbi:MAG TPA: ATP-binding protein [Desulfomonilia bacterium]|nr:ATP-binding protein [Desulfomonilia bacterium]